MMLREASSSTSALSVLWNISMLSSPRRILRPALDWDMCIKVSTGTRIYVASRAQRKSAQRSAPAEVWTATADAHCAQMASPVNIPQDHLPDSMRLRSFCTAPCLQALSEVRRPAREPFRSYLFTSVGAVVRNRVSARQILRCRRRAVAYLMSMGLSVLKTEDMITK
jgi:hypothetical protein